MRLALTLTASICVAIPAQVCPRPPAPGLGHPLVLEPVQLVDYSDSYRTEGELLRPAIAAPTCGWPLVVFIHRLGQSRWENRALQEMIAAQGYAVWAYDVRGQGFALLHNPQTAGTTMWGPVERADLAEQIAFALQTHPGLIDPARIAVVGSSQGSVHAWAAAALSGQAFTVPGRSPVTFPEIGCVVANDYVAEPVIDWIRGGMLWSFWFVTLIADDTQRPFILDEAFRQQARAAFVAQDAPSLLAAWDQEGRRIDGSLTGVTVPVLYSHAYFDLIDSPMATLELLRQMPVETPTRALMSTIGHNTPFNNHELAFRDSVMLRWLHRFLWGELNEVDLEDRYVLSVVPLERTKREDPGWPWGRSFGGDPLSPGVASRLHLHDDGVLGDVEPAAMGTPTAIDQEIIDPNFTAGNYISAAANRTLPAILAACPLSERVFAAAPLADERQLDGVAAVSLLITPDRPRWMIAALLTVEPPGGEEFMLSSRAHGSVSSAAGVAERVEFQLPPVAVVLPAGTVVRLYLRSLWLREYPMTRQLEVAPLFDDFHLEISHDGGGMGSWLDLPFVMPTVQLVSRTLHMELSVMNPLQLLVRGGQRHAGGIYYVTVGASGQVPAITRHGTTLAMQADWLSGLVESSILAPEFQGFLGDLDAVGEGTAVLNASVHAPLDPVFMGTRLTFGAFAFPPGALWPGSASNPLDVLLR